jgi:RND family efflux transporter MFP subunit
MLSGRIGHPVPEITTRTGETMYRIALTFIMPGLLSMIMAGCTAEPPEKEEPVRPIKAFQVVDIGQQRTRSFPGRAKAHNEVDLSFRVAGQLIELRNDIIGQKFARGDTIARLDPRDYEVRVDDVSGQLERSQASARRAQSDYQRELNIYREDAGATSKTTVENKLAARDQAVAEVRSLKASLEAAKDDLGYTYLNAPFDGAITAKYVDNFQDVQAKEKIVRLLDSSKIEMVVDIPENKIADLPHVENITVTYDAFPNQPVPADIYEVGTEASLTTRTYPVTLIMDQPQDFTILAGMAGRARGLLKVYEGEAARNVHVPVAAVFTPQTENRSYVWVIDESTGAVSRRAVMTGELVQDGIEVLEGLGPGDWVATAGVFSLKEGQRVSIMQRPGE